MEVNVGVLISTWHLAMEGPGGNPTSTSQAVYLRNVATFFASSHRNNPGARHVFFTNLQPNSGNCVEPFGHTLSSMGVETIRLEHSYAVPGDYAPTWRSQFFLMDVLAHLAEIVEPADSVFVLDSDCVWVASVAELHRRVVTSGILAYDTGFTENQLINGLTRRQIGEICSKLDLSRSYSSPPCAGGEFIGLTGLMVRQLSTELPKLWTRMIDQYQAGELRFLTEEHWLTYLYLRLDADIGGANQYIRRIWTSIPPRVRDARQSDLDLAIWHLPAEKRYGLSRLYTQVINVDSAFWSLPLGRPFAKYLGSYLGVPRRTIKKALWDAKDGVVWKWGKVTQK